MTWEEDAKVQAESVQARRARKAAVRKAERDAAAALVETAMGEAMTKAVRVLTQFKDLFGKRFVPTRSIRGEPSALQEFGIKDAADMNRRLDVIRVGKDRIEVRVDGVKYECDFVYDVQTRKLMLDPRPTKYPNDGRALHPRHVEDLHTGRAFESGMYLGAVAVEWAKKHNYTRLD